MPEALVHRVIVRESKYHPGLVGRGGTIGLMQIKLATARGLGYTGDAAGLRDPDTNLAYGVKYLAGAYRAANGDHNRAVHYYASGYYYAAKRQRLERPVQPEPVLASAPPKSGARRWSERQKTLRRSGRRTAAKPSRARHRVVARETQDIAQGLAEARRRFRIALGRGKAVQTPQSRVDTPAHRPTLALFRGELR